MIVNESMAIMQYLEEAYPEVPLLPSSVAERAVVYQRMHESMALQTSLTPLFHMGMASQGDGDEKKVRLQCRPTCAPLAVHKRLDTHCMARFAPPSGHHTNKTVSGSSTGWFHRIDRVGRLTGILVTRKA